jgi:hypothetical protein
VNRTVASCVLAGTETAREDGPDETVTAGSAPTVTSLGGAPEAVGPPPPLQPITTLPAAIKATAVIAAWRRPAAAAPRRITRVTGRNSTLTAAHVQYGTDIQKA